MQTRYRKVIGDLKSDYVKNAMLVIAIAIGAFGIGTILGSKEVLNREMEKNYMSTNPASATLEIENGISHSLLDSVKNFPGIKAVERRATIVARMKANNRWYPILLFVIDDFEKANINGFEHLTGEVTPATGTMLVERTALNVMNASEGDSITIRTSNQNPKSILISGTVHDAGLAPAGQEQAGYAYISLATLHLLDSSQNFDLLRIQVSENENSRDHVTQISKDLADYLKPNGHEVHEIQIPPIGKHPHQSQMNAILTIFTLFSFMILVLVSILLSTSMSTLMVKQIRQIGVMKTMGGTSWQISKMYIFMMLILCLIALLIAIPLSRLAAYGFYLQIAKLLNLKITDHSIPLSVPLIQIASGIVIPLLMTALPLIKGSRISVRLALDNYGVSKNQVSDSWLTRMLSQMHFLNDTFQITIRNAVRQKSRLILSLSLLAAGGAMFMTALNVSKSWDKNLEQIYVQRLYDQEIRLNERVDMQSLASKLKNIKGIRAIEGWDYSSTSFVNESNYEITRTYPDKGHGSFIMLALPIPTQLLNPSIKEGRWLNQSGSNEVVLNQQARNSDWKIGDSIKLGLAGQISTWTIVGFTEDVGSSATAYVSLADFAKIKSTDGNVKMLRVAYDDRSRNSSWKKSAEIDEVLEKQNIGVDQTMPVWLLHNAVAAHMRILVNSLIAMAILMALVGALGLTSSISMSVLERTREIGVMRALGATPKKIKTLTIWEGLLIGLFSVIFAFLISLISSYYLSDFIGYISFRTPLSLTVSLIALLIWVGIIIAGSYIATLYPAQRAVKITTREALAYE